MQFILSSLSNSDTHHRNPWCKTFLNRSHFPPPFPKSSNHFIYAKICTTQSSFFLFTPPFLLHFKTIFRSPPNTEKLARHCCCFYCCRCAMCLFVCMCFFRLNIHSSVDLPLSFVFFCFYLRCNFSFFLGEFLRRVFSLRIQRACSMQFLLRFENYICCCRFQHLFGFACAAWKIYRTITIKLKQFICASVSILSLLLLFSLFSSIWPPLVVSWWHTVDSWVVFFFIFRRILYISFSVRKY